MTNVKNNIRPKHKILGRIYFLAYLIMLVYLLFFAEAFGRTENPAGSRSNKLVPFKEIWRFYKYRHILGIQAFIINVPGNILAFIPFGFFIPIISKYKRSFIRTAFMGMLFSLSVEIIQFIVNVGSFDIDDIILNTLGCIMGYIMFLLADAVILKFKKMRR